MINLNSPANKRDPFALYAHLRSHSPVCQVNPGPVWAITRYRDVQFALKRSDLFSSAGIKSFVAPDWLREDCRHDLFIVTQDGEEHAKHRALVNKAFVAKVIDALVPLMKKTASALLDNINAHKGSVDFIEAFSYPYINAIISNITGIENQSVQDVRRWIALTEGLSPVKPNDPEYIHELESAMRRQIQYFHTVIANRRKHPRADLVTALVQAEVDGEQLSDDLLNNALDMLIRAGFMTTAYLLSSCIALLGQDMALLQRLKHTPTAIPDFIDEMLRWQPPVLATVRRTTAAVTLGDTAVPPDSLALIMIGSANRDAAVFSHADQFDMARENNKEHLAFGYGPHVCVGLALARLEVKIALESILARYERIACPPANELWADSYLIRGLETLPCRFYPQ